MSLQIPIQKDIGEYDEKIVGKLTLRTLCCLALGFSAAVAVAAVLHWGLKVDVSAMTLPIIDVYKRQSLHGVSGSALSPHRTQPSPRS